MISLIRIEKLSSGYDKKQILFDVDFEATDQMTIIIGANGSGKSTLLKSICGLCDIYSGSIMLDAMDITDIPTHTLPKLGISYMAQRNNVFADLNIYENLVMAAFPDKPDLDYVFDFFPMLRDHKTKKARQLSGGQRQLLAIGMNMLKKPKIMLFDEPTASLSPRNSGIILEKIREIQNTLKNCVIIVEQNVTGALNVGDMCYLLASGKIVTRQEPKTLLSDKNFGAKYLGVSQNDNPN